MWHEVQGIHALFRVLLFIIVISLTALRPPPPLPWSARDSVACTERETTRAIYAHACKRSHLYVRVFKVDCLLQLGTEKRHTHTRKNTHSLCSACRSHFIVVWHLNYHNDPFVRSTRMVSSHRHLSHVALQVAISPYQPPPPFP